MKSFKQFLYENSENPENENSKNSKNSKNKHSWLDPNGFFYPLSANIDHYTWAKNHLKDEEDEMAKKNPMHFLYKNNWFRINFYGKELMVNNPFKKLNDNQKIELKNLAIENKMSEIFYDNDVKLISIWKNDEF